MNIAHFLLALLQKDHHPLRLLKSHTPLSEHFRKHVPELLIIIMGNTTLIYTN